MNLFPILSPMSGIDRRVDCLSYQQGRHVLSHIPSPLLRWLATLGRDIAHAPKDLDPFLYLSDTSSPPPIKGWQAHGFTMCGRRRSALARFRDRHPSLGREYTSAMCREVPSSLDSTESDGTYGGHDDMPPLDRHVGEDPLLRFRRKTHDQEEGETTDRHDDEEFAEYLEHDPRSLRCRRWLMGSAVEPLAVAECLLDVERIDPIGVHVADVDQEGAERFRLLLHLRQLDVLSHFGFETSDLSLRLRFRLEDAPCTTRCFAVHVTSFATVD